MKHESPKKITNKGKIAAHLHLFLLIAFIMCLILCTLYMCVIYNCQKQESKSPLGPWTLA